MDKHGFVRSKSLLSGQSLEGTKYLPVDVRAIGLKLVAIRRNTFINEATRNNEDYTDWLSPELMLCKESSHNFFRKAFKICQVVVPSPHLIWQIFDFFLLKVGKFLIYPLTLIIPADYLSWLPLGSLCVETWI